MGITAGWPWVPGPGALELAQRLGQREVRARPAGEGSGWRDGGAGGWD